MVWGGAVENKALHGFDLSGDDGGAGFQSLQDDIAGLVRVVDAVGGTNLLAAAVRHLERNAGQRLVLRALNVLVDREDHLGIIFEGKAVAAAITVGSGIGHSPAAGHAVDAVFHDNSLRGRIKNIAAGDAALAHNYGAARYKPGDSNCAVLAGSVAA